MLPAWATAEPRYGIEITPFAGYRLGGEFEAGEEADPSTPDIDLDDASTFGLAINWRAEENTEWEVYASRQSTSLDTAGLFAPEDDPPADLDITYLQVGGTYWFEGEHARPFIVATVGVSRFEPDDAAFDSEAFFAFSIGGGYKLWPTSRLGLRLEGRLFGSIVDSDEAVFCRTSGEVSGCLVAASGDALWQWELMAGLVFRL
jgi:hypothetical protein